MSFSSSQPGQLYHFSWLPFATGNYNRQSVVFIEVGKWLEKRPYRQRNSSCEQRESACWRGVRESEGKIPVRQLCILKNNTRP